MNPYIVLSNALDHLDSGTEAALFMVDDGVRELRLQALEDAGDILGWAQGQLQLEHRKAERFFWMNDEPLFLI